MEKELEEKQRHDVRYREVENDELYIEPNHWEKFDSIKKHTTVILLPWHVWDI
jgi:hypothetical protein